MKLIIYSKKVLSKPYALLLLAIIILGLLLRTIYLGSVPFQHWDDVFTARTIIRYYPKSTTEFRLIPGSPTDPANPLSFITSVHGVVTLILGFIWMHIVALAGLPINEFMWHLPFALFGSTLSISSFLLGKKLQNTQTGVIAALFTSVLPIHVAFSRISGEGHFIVATGFQQFCLLAWIMYLYQPSKKKALFVGTLLAITILTDFFFIGIILTMLWASFLYRRDKNILSIIKDFFQIRIIGIIILPFLFQLLLAAYSWIRNRPVGMFGRVITQFRNGESQLSGINLQENILNLFSGSNIIFIIAVLLAIIIYAIWFRANYASSVSLVYAIVYITPLIIIQRERLIGHYIPVLAVLCLFLATIINKIVENRSTLLGITISGIIALSLFITTMSMVYKIPSIRFLETKPEHGAVGVDSGIKAAAWWIRNNTNPNAVVFGDAFAGQDFASASYYYHRSVVGLAIPFPNHDASVQAALQNEDKLDFLVLGINNIQLYPKDFIERWHIYAVITVNYQPKLYIYGRKQTIDSFNKSVFIESTEINHDFDQRYLTYPAIVQYP